jgi:hypothetical protein
MEVLYYIDGTRLIALANAAVLREGEGLVADDRRVRARCEPVHRFAALCARFSSSMRDTFAAATVSSYYFRLYYYCFT